MELQSLFMELEFEKTVFYFSALIAIYMILHIVFTLSYKIDIG